MHACACLHLAAGINVHFGVCMSLFVYEGGGGVEGV